MVIKPFFLPAWNLYKIVIVIVRNRCIYKEKSLSFDLFVAFAYIASSPALSESKVSAYFVRNAVI